MAAEVGVVAQSANKFALDLHEILRNEGSLVDENLFYSPASLLIALAMTCFGARGKTAEELASVLHLMPDSSSGPNMKKFLSSLNSSSDNNTHRGPTQSVCVADCYFIVNVLDLPFASPTAIYR